MSTSFTRLDAMRLALRAARPSNEPPHKRIGKALRNLRAAWAHPDLFDDARQEARLAPLREALSGRSVAVVGNAASLLESAHGAAIDAHDVVVRFNRGFVRNPASQGRRTSIHCLATQIAPDLIMQAWPDAELLFLSPLRFYLPPALRERSAVLPVARWSRLLETLGARPSAGLLALDLFRETALSRMTLYGFDWKESRTFYHEERRPGWHDWRRERDLVGRWLAEDARIGLG